MVGKMFHSFLKSLFKRNEVDGSDERHNRRSKEPEENVQHVLLSLL